MCLRRDLWGFIVYWARKLGRDNALISSIRPWKADFGYSSSGHESHWSQTHHGKLDRERRQKTKEVEKRSARCFDKWRWSSVITILCMTFWRRFSPEKSSVVSITFSSHAYSIFNGCRLMHVSRSARETPRFEGFEWRFRCFSVGWIALNNVELKQCVLASLSSVVFIIKQMTFRLCNDFLFFILLMISASFHLFLSNAAHFSVF